MLCSTINKKSVEESCRTATGLDYATSTDIAIDRPPPPLSLSLSQHISPGFTHTAAQPFARRGGRRSTLVGADARHLRRHHRLESDAWRLQM